MCVVAIAYEAHPDWRLIVAGNRDEFHERASAPLARWDDGPAIIAGRDLVSGGTWMGVSDAGRFAVVTNIRSADGPDPDKLSRGALVADWLTAGTTPADPRDFNAFNLIASDRQSIRFVSNRPEPTLQTLPTGLHGLSNAIPDEHWPRKDRLIAAMADWLASPAADPKCLMDLLADESTRDREAHPIFIRSPVYGTRCSTVIAIGAKSNGRITERRFDAGGTVTGETSIDFVWPQ